METSGISLEYTEQTENSSKKNKNGIKERAKVFYRKFHSSATHERAIILYNYIILFIVAGIYIICGMSYYVSVYQQSDINDDAAQAINPGYSWFRALYFLVVTMFGVGYGDVRAATEASMLFTAFFILFGVCLGGTYVGLVISHIQEHSDRLAALKDKEFGRKLAAIHSKKISARSIGDIHKVIGKRLSVMNATIMGVDHDAGTLDNDDTNADTIEPDIIGDNDEELDEYGLNKNEEKTMFDMSEKAFNDEVTKIVKQFFLDMFSICVAIFVGMGAMIGIEGWTPIQAFYWAVVSISTVGYGDLYASDNEGRLFTIFYLLICVPLLITSLGSIVKIPSLLRIRRKEMSLIQKFGGGGAGELKPEVLQKIVEADLFKAFPMLKRDEKETSRAEFVILMLHMMNRIKEKDLIFACKTFDRLDKTGDGLLDESDITGEIERIMNSGKMTEGEVVELNETNDRNIKADNV